MTTQLRPTKVLYHANCPDGFCAAWAAYTSLGDAAEYIPVNYGQEPPDVRGCRVFIVDFSYKREVMRRILSHAYCVTVLDHHKTAEAELAGLLDEAIMRPDLIPPDLGSNPEGYELSRIHFDMNKSGGRLAWEHFRPKSDTPWLVEYTEDRDMWWWKLPNSREVNAGLACQPKEFAVWCALDTDPDSLSRMAADGQAITRYESSLVDSICRNAREIELGGHMILAANTSVLFSDVAGKLAESRPFGAAWFIRADGKTQWSLRSRDGGIDVSEIAKQRGGGGHRNAAGFEE